jgi:hypothetical protein
VIRFVDYREKFARLVLRTATGGAPRHFAPRALTQLAIPKSGLLAITAVIDSNSVQLRNAQGEIKFRADVIQF